MLEIGRRILHYRIVEKISQGGMGEVDPKNRGLFRLSALYS
jgi:hypothetical protein